jgi:hypothetical protein
LGSAEWWGKSNFDNVQQISRGVIDLMHKKSLVIRLCEVGTESSGDSFSPALIDKFWLHGGYIV